MKRLILIRRVVGHSMLPTLKPNQIVVASSLAKPKIGSIVIAKAEGKEIIKRVASIKGDQVILKGDNPSDSRDSRAFGGVPRTAVIARVLFIK